MKLPTTRNYRTPFRRSQPRATPCECRPCRRRTNWHWCAASRSTSNWAATIATATTAEEPPTRPSSTIGAIRRAPATWSTNPSRARAIGAVYFRLAVGMPGTAHPAAAGTPDEELVDLVHFVLSLAGQPVALTNHKRWSLSEAAAYLRASSSAAQPVSGTPFASPDDFLFACSVSSRVVCRRSADRASGAGPHRSGKQLPRLIQQSPRAG